MTQALGRQHHTTALWHRSRHQRIVVTGAASILALGITGCTSGKSTTSSGNAKTGGTFTYAVPVNVPSFDPYATNAGSGEMAFLAYLAYDSLVNQDANGNFVSGLAKTWQTSSTKTTFVLKSGITCSDGSTLTAAQVAKDLSYVGNPKNLTPYTGTSTPTVPYTATGNDATRTITVTTSKPFGLTLQTLGSIPIVCAAGLTNRKVLSTTSAGTGPFVLKSASQGTYTFQTRKHYAWGPGGATMDTPGTPAELVVKSVTNFTTASSELLAGQLNGARITGADVTRLTSAGLPHADVPYQKAGLSFNEHAGRPTADEAVRRALVQAINPQAVANVINGTPATGVRAGKPLACPGASVKKELPTFNSAEAGQALDAAGWIKGPDGVRQKNGKKLSLTIYYQGADANVLELIQSDWKAVGVDTKIHVTTSQEAQDLYSKGTGNWDATYGGYVTPLPIGLEPYVSGPFPPKGYNYAAVVNNDYDKYAAKATEEPGAAGCSLWVKAENSLLKSADFVPIADANIQVFTSKNASAKANSLRIPIPTSLKLH